MDTRKLTARRIAQANDGRPGCPTVAFVCCVALPLVVLYTQQQQPVQDAPLAIIESVRPLEPIGGRPHAAVLPAAAAVLPSTSPTAAAQQPLPTSTALVRAEHESAQPMAVLNRERARTGGREFASAFKVYRPAPGHVRT